MAGACLAQSEAARTAAEPAKYFRLEFVVKELESGKAVNARHYAMTVSTADGGTSIIRTGSKVPVATSPNTSTYIDVGVNIDCRAAKEIGSDLGLNVTAEVSSTASPSSQPVVRQTKWNSNVIVPLGKPTVVFSSDDVTTKGQMQLELTATPIK
jgi:hypothetical protein